MTVPTSTTLRSHTIRTLLPIRNTHNLALTSERDEHEQEPCLDISMPYVLLSWFGGWSGIGSMVVFTFFVAAGGRGILLHDRLMK